MKRTIIFGMSVVAAAFPGHGHMQTSESLEDAVQAWESVDAQIGEEEAVQSAEIQYQSNADIFPDVELSAEESRLEQLRNERIADFISVTIDGSLVVFQDVPRTSWFAPYVRDIAEKGIVSGYRDASGNPTGSFGPQDNVTIEQMAKVMVYAGGHPLSACGGTVLNVTASGSWSAPYVGCAEFLQWAVYGDGTADVHRNATRAEVIITLMQAFKVEPIARTGTGFTDVTLSTQFGAAIEQAQRDGIVAGYTDDEGMPNGLFGPEDPVTRAEFAKIVTLGMQIYKK